MTTQEKSSLTGPETFMVVFSDEKEEDSVKKFVGNRRKNFAIYKMGLIRVSNQTAVKIDTIKV